MPDTFVPPVNTDTNELADNSLNVTPAVAVQGVDQPLNLPIYGNSSPYKPSNGGPKQDAISSLENLASSIDKGSSFHPQDYSYISKQNLPDNIQRYDTYYPGLNNENIAAEKQGTGELMAKSVANMAMSFTKTVVESVTAPLAGVGYLLGDNPSTGFFDNPYNKWLSNWTEGNGKYTIYESDKRKNANWWSTDYWATGNTLNNVLSTVGDLAGFAITGLVAGATVGRAISWGAEELGMLGKSYDKALSGIAELSAALPEGELGIKATAELSEGLKSIQGSTMLNSAKQEAATKLISDIGKKYVGQVNVLNKVQQATIGTVTNLGMAQSSAYESSNAFRQKAIARIHEQGREVSPDEMEKIEEGAKSVAMATGTIMTVMGAVTLHGLLKGSIAKKEGQALVRNEINDVEEIAAKNIGTEEAPQMVSQYGKVKPSPYSATTIPGKVAEHTVRFAKTAGKTFANHFDVMPAIGMVEFGLAPSSVESYYDKKYETGDASIINDALIPNVKNIFSKEGATSFMLGLVAGNLVEGVQGHGKTAREEKAKNTTAFVDAINSSYIGTFFKANVDAAKRGGILRKEYLEAIRSGDKSKEHDLRQAQWENYIYPRIKYGKKSFVDKDLQSYKKLSSTDEGIRQLQADGMIPEGDNLTDLRKDFHDHLENLQTYTNNAEVYHNALTLKYGNTVDKNGNKVYGDEHIEKLMFLSGGIDDASRRIKDLSETVRNSPMLEDLDFQQKFTGLLKILNDAKSIEPLIGALKTEHINNIFKDINNLSVNPDKKDALLKDFGDVIKLNIKKKQYINEYNHIVNAPELSKDTVKQSAPGTEGVIAETKKGEVIPGVITKNRQPMNLEIGEKYYAGERVVPGHTEEGKTGGFREFPAFTVTGHSVGEDGKRMIEVTDEEGNTHQVHESTFSKYKLGKVADLDKPENHNARYWFNNRNSEYEYMIRKGEKVTGRLRYDADKDEFSLVYKDKEGKVRETTVEKDHFRVQPQRNTKGEIIRDGEGKPFMYDKARLRKIGEITKDDQEWIEAKETKREQEQRQKKLDGKIEIITKLVDGKKQLLKKVEDDLLDHEIKLEQIQKTLKETQDKVENYPQRENRGNMTKDTKKFLSDTIGTTRELSKMANDLQNTIDKLQKQADAIQSEIDYFSDFPVETLPNGKAVFGFIANMRKNSQDQILDIGIKINTLSKIIDKIKDVIKGGLEIIGKYISKIRSAHPDVEIPENVSFIPESINKYVDNITSLTGETIPELLELKKHIADILEMDDITVRQSDVQKASDHIDSLYKELQQVNKEMKLQQELYDAFLDRYRQYKLEEKKSMLMNSPEYLEKLQQIQGKMDEGYIAFDPTKQETTKSYDPASKPVNKIFNSTVLPSTGNPAEFDQFVERFNTFTTNSNIGFPVPEGVNSDDTKVKKADIEEKRQEELKNGNKAISAVDPNNKESNFIKVGDKWNDGYHATTRNVTNADNYDGREDSYTVIRRINKPAEFDNEGKLTKAPDVDLMNFNNKEDADKFITDQYEKVKSGTEKRQKEVNDKYDAELKSLDNKDEYVGSRGDYQENKRVIVITRQNQHHYFPAGVELVPATFGDKNESNGTDNPHRAAIAVVHVYKDGKTFRFIDKDGKLLGEVGKGDADPNQIIFSRMETVTDDPKRENGYDRFHIPTGTSKEDAAEIIADEKKRRTVLINNPDPSKKYEFGESLGKPNYIQENGEQKQVKNSVADAKLIQEKDINNSSIQIATVKSDTGSSAIQVGNTTIPAAPGRFMLVHNNNVSYLNPSMIKDLGLTDHLYDAIKAMAESRIQNKGAVNNVYSEYLGSVLHFSSKTHEDKGIAANQLFLKDGFLGFRIKQGEDLIPHLVNFVPEDLESSKELIKQWLDQAYHSGNVKTLGRSGGFVEITKINHGEKGELIEPTTKRWDSYGKYLLSGEEGKRKEVPMTTNIVSGEKGPFLSKYITVDFKGDFLPEADYTKTKKTKPEKKEPILSGDKNTIIIDKKPIKLDDTEYVSKTGSSKMFGAFSYDYTVKLEDSKIVATVKNLEAENPDTDLKELKKSLETKLSKKLTEDYKPVETFTDTSTPGGNHIITVGKKTIVLDGKTETSKPATKQKIGYDYIASIEGDQVKATIVKFHQPTGVEEMTHEYLEGERKKAEPAISKALTAEYKKLQTEQKQEPEVVTKTETTPETKTISDSDDAFKQLLKQNAAKNESNVKESDNFNDFMEVVPGEVIEHTENVQEFHDFLKGVLSKVDFESLPEIIRSGDISAYGRYKDKLIQVYRDAPYGTGYHEAFHAVWDMFLTDKQQQELYDEFRAKAGTFHDRLSGETVHGNATDKQVKEAIAEMFREYKKENKSFSSKTRIGDFFRRIVDFVKNFIYGEHVLTIDKLFDKINKGEYKYSRFVKRAPEEESFSAIKNMTAPEKKYVVEGIFERVLGSLANANGGLVRLADGMTDKELFEPIFEKLKVYYTNPDVRNGLVDRTNRKIAATNGNPTMSPDAKKIAIAAAENEAMNAYAIWGKVEAEKANVIKDLKSYLRKYGIVFEKNKRNTDVVENDRFENEQVSHDSAEDNKDRGYDFDTLTFDAKENAPIEIKLAFASLVDIAEGKNPNLNANYGESLKEPEVALNPFMLPQLTNGKKYMSMVLNAMDGILNPDDIQSTLFDLAKNDPALVRLYNRIYKAPKDLGDWRLQISFYNFATKIAPDYLYSHIDSGRNSVIKSASLDTEAHAIARKWENDMRSDTTGIAFIDENGTYRANTKELISPEGASEVQKLENTIKFLQQINFPVDASTMNRLSGPERGKLIKEAKDLYNRLRTSGDSVILTRKAMDTSAVGKISKLLAKTTTVPTETSHNNMDGNRVQNNVMYNGLTRMTSLVNSAKTLGKLFEIEPRYANDIFVRNCVLLKPGGPLFDENGVSKKNKLTYTVIEGMGNDNSSVGQSAISGMGIAGRTLTILNHILGRDGKLTIPNFIVADSKTEGATTTTHYISAADYQVKKERNKLFNDITEGYLKDEIDIIKDANKRTLLSGARDNDNFKKLQIFKDILPEELVNKITEHANNPEDVSTEEFLKPLMKEVHEAVHTFVEDQVQKEFDDLVDYKVIEKTSSGYRFHGVNTEALKALGIKGKVHDIDTVKDILRFADMNLFVHLTEMRKMFYGPWYEVSDAPKRDKLLQSGTTNTYSNNEKFNTWADNNLNKSGTVDVKQGESGYHRYKNSFHQMTFAEVQSHSEKHGEIEGSVGSGADPYKKMDEMDAQGLVMPGYWKEYTLRSGEKWDDADEAQHQYDIAAQREADYKRPETIAKGLKYRKDLQEADRAILDKGNPHTPGTGAPKKPVGVGMQKSDTQSMPYADKTSILRMTYPIAKERGMEDLFWFLHDNDIAMVGPKSWQKYGRKWLQEYEKTGGLPELYRINNGKVEFNLDKIPQEHVEELKSEIPWDTFNKIVETAKSKEGKTRGTQALSMLTVNSIVHGLPTDIYNVETDDFLEKKSYWDSLKTNDAKRKASDTYRRWDDHNKAIAERSIRGYHESLKKLGIVETKDGYELKHVDRVVDFLKSEVTRRDLPDNVAIGLDWETNSDGEQVLKYPLEAMANYQTLNNILWSTFDKNILSPTMNGTDNILASGTLFEGRGMRKIVNRDGKEFLASSELNFYKRGENGKKTSEMEVYAPNHLIKKLRAAGVQLSDKELFDYLNTNEGQKLIKAIGFRIPTQGMNSIDAVKIVPWDAKNNQYFLPEEMGNTVIVPSEIVTKVGADFDIDKMGTYHFNFFVDDKGYPRKVEFIDDLSTDEGLEKLYEQRKKQKALDIIADTTDDVRGKTHDELREVIRKAEKEIGDIDKFIEDNKGKNLDPWKENSTAAIENKYFDTMSEILLHPSSYDQLVTPNSTKEMEDTLEDISKLMNKGGKERAKGDVNYSNLLKLSYLIRERQDYRDATGNSIGIAAQKNTLHAQSQLAYLPVEDRGYGTKEERALLGDHKIYLPHRQLKVGDRMVTTLSGLKNDVGMYISDFVSQIINGAVDAVKNKWLIEILQNKDLLSTSLYLGEVGTSPKNVFYFINQPVIQELVRQETIYKDIQLINPNMQRKYAADIVADIRKGLGGAGKPRTTMFTTKELGEVLASEKSLYDLSGEHKKLQAQVLSEFLKYRTQAQHSLDEQLAFLTANMNRLTEAGLGTKNNRIVKAKEGSSLGIMRNLEGKTFHSSIMDVLNKSQKAKETITQVASHPALKGIFKTFTDLKKFIKEDDRNRIIGKSVLSFIDYGAQVKSPGRSLNKFIDTVLIDHNTNTAKLLVKSKKAATGEMKRVFDNVLNVLNAVLDSNANGVKSVKLSVKPATGIEADILTEALRTLRDNPSTNDLYKRLVTASFLQTGLQSDRGSYHSYLPNEDVVKFMQPVIERLLSEDMSSFVKTNAFYRNNWRDESIVPRIKSSEDRDTGVQYYNYYRNNNLPGTRFLNVAESSNSRYPVVKIVPDRYHEITGEDLGEQKTELYQQVLNEEGQPFIIDHTKTGKNIYLYKQINAWGDGNKMQEHYEEGRPSVLDKHEHVKEIGDDLINQTISSRNATSSDVRDNKQTLGFKQKCP